VKVWQVTEQTWMKCRLRLKSSSRAGEMMQAEVVAGERCGRKNRAWLQMAANGSAIELC